MSGSLGGYNSGFGGGGGSMAPGGAYGGYGPMSGAYGQQGMWPQQGGWGQYNPQQQQKALAPGMGGGQGGIVNMPSTDGQKNIPPLGPSPYDQYQGLQVMSGGSPPMQPAQQMSTGYPALPPQAAPQAVAATSWRNMSPGQRADAQRLKSLGGQQPAGGLPVQSQIAQQPAMQQPPMQQPAMTQPQQPVMQKSAPDNGYGYGTPGGYQFDTAQSTLDPNSMNFLLNWLGGTVNGQNPQQQSQGYLDTYRQRYPNGVPGVNNPTTPWTNYLIGQRF